ncbi:tRNA guanosine(34) transglycosylase Tgt [Candidatus Berkelbacteria bacterium]|nr:tRNA guanosine(34) transglycosylase Tgt [Candidatus Berkelbacteria bacterium]
MQYKVRKTLPDSLARLGEVTTPSGKFNTPAFMPVGTQGAVKTLSPWELEELDAEIILGNTYHLHIRPGEELINNGGGLQKWSSWNKPILTDSGGYQAYSLGATRQNSAKTTDEGVKFSSHIDGKKLFFTPESVLDIQHKLGSDIAMVLDDCPPIETDKARVAIGVKRTSDWAKRSMDYWQKQNYAFSKNSNETRALFGIIQGGVHEDLRKVSLEAIQSLPFDGIAIGGVAIESEGKEKINFAVDSIAQLLDKNRPHYLMGVGEPEDLIRMVHLGMDMFDCVIPTRFARHGAFWLKDGYKRVSIENSKYRDDFGPLDPDCSCKICKNFSRSYLRHLYVSGETFALRALSYHNLALILGLMQEIRESIESGQFTNKYQRYLVHLKYGREEGRHSARS